ncbi:MAG TPA: hypothetical protein PKM25_10235 [Candidatus Ozemobacteraceae bacterium]|nr:hypothetical protein [Candidatus Ozemobacteraceae bacterium]
MVPGDSGRFRAASGAALLALTILLLIMGFSLSVILPRANLDVKRAKEDELRFILGEFRRASEKFSFRNGRHPLSLDELCRDEKGQRFLRRIYDDPMTGKGDWSVRYAPEGLEIRSSSQEESTGGIPYRNFQ